MITFKINDQEVTVPEGTTILNAANSVGIKIPTLCFLKEQQGVEFQSASCRVCMVEEPGRQKMLAACSTKAWNGLQVRTDTPRVIKTRRAMIELLLSNHPKDCLICHKNGDCELQSLAAECGVREVPFQGEMNKCRIDHSSLSIVRDMNKCILCKRCQEVCTNVQSVGCLTDVGRGFHTVVGTAFDMPMIDTTCTFCGQCLAVCPTGALAEVDNTSKVWDALVSGKTVVVQTAPAVRVALGEMFGMEPGEVVTGKMVGALRMLGFDYVYDTNFAADVTIMEEAAELVHRLKHGGVLPILTSCCPSWIKFIEHNFGDMLEIPSSCKSPHEMFGALAKTYLADRLKIDREDMVVVSVMPCVAKKYESARPELSVDGASDVDIVISTRELGHMLREIGVRFDAVPDSEFDDFMGESSGAGTIFGVTGGVLEATLRTAYEWITGETLDQVVFEDLRGYRNVKSATIDIQGKPFRVASASGLKNARMLLNKIRSGEEKFDAIEIMACPGGCIAGGGQPLVHQDYTILEKRMAAIYRIDERKVIRQSHKNPSVIRLYDEFIGEPYGERAHALLHTEFKMRTKM